MTSKHYQTDRQAREAIIRQIGMGQVIKSVVVDKGHINGPEIHEVTSTGIVVIYNQRTRKMITKLIARPAQIERYYEEGKAPEYLIKIAFEHQTKKYNKA